MAGKAAHKVLRIGIIEDEKIVQERLITAGENVTVGESPNNTFVFHKANLPRAEYPLFVARSGKYVLNFTEEMEGKISAGGSVAALGKLRTDPSVPKQGGSWRLALTEQDRGKISIGNVTILFQFVAPPPKQMVKPIQQMDFRAHWLEEDDPVFLGFLAIFSALATVMIVWIMNTEAPKITSLDQIPDRFTKMILKPEKDEPEPEPEVDPDNTVEEVEAPPDEGPPEEVEVKPKPAPKNRVEVAKQRDDLKNQVMEQSALLKLLVTTGKSSGGFAANLIAEGGGDFGDVEALASGSGNELTAASTKIRVGKGGGTADAGIGELADAKAGNTKLQAAPKAQIKGSTSLGAGDADLDEGDAGSVKKIVKRNFSQLTYCYESRLKNVPGLAGRVEIEWYVSGGLVSDAQVYANTTGDTELGKCIIKKIKRWKFDSSVSGEILYPFIFKPK